MANHLPDVLLTDEWQDLVELYPAIADTKITVQAKFVEKCFIFAGSEFTGNEDEDVPAADSTEGSLLLSGTAITGSSDKWFVRGKGKISIFVED